VAQQALELKFARIWKHLDERGRRMSAANETLQNEGDPDYSQRVSRRMELHQQQFSWPGPLRKQRGRGSMTAVAAYCLREVTQHVAPLPLASLRHGESAAGGDFAVAAAVPETNLAPLHRSAQHPFDYMVGRLHALYFHKC
jgi:hypothetical protein